MAQIWRFHADEHSVTEWLDYVQLHAGHRVDSTGGLTPLSGAELETLWQSPLIKLAHIEP